MTELHVTLDFACCDCEQAVAVTVQCTGKGLTRRDGTLTVNVPCPSCGQVNRVVFEPGGTVASVRPFCRQPLPTYSVN